MKDNVENKVVILGDGTFPTSEYPISLIREADCIVCCDSSILKLLNFYGTQEIESLGQKIFIVGDMDTLPQEYQLKFKEYIHKDPCQETNDQTKAFMFAQSLHPSEIHLIGTTGGREDHTLGNISLLADYGKIMYKNNNTAVNNPETNNAVEIVTDNGIFRPIYDTCTFHCRKGVQISIFSFDSNLKIKSAGLKYPTDNVLFDMWWKATLNEAAEETVTLSFSHRAKVLLFFAF